MSTTEYKRIGLIILNEIAQNPLTPLKNFTNWLEKSNYPAHAYVVKNFGNVILSYYNNSKPGRRYVRQNDDFEYMRQNFANLFYWVDILSEQQSQQALDCCLEVMKDLYKEPDVVRTDGIPILNIATIVYTPLILEQKSFTILQRKYQAMLNLQLAFPECNLYADNFCVKYQPCGHCFHTESVLELVLSAN